MSEQDPMGLDERTDGVEPVCEAAARIRARLAARAGSVPCGLRDGTDCKDGDDWRCPLRDDDDCPELQRKRAEKRAAARRAAGEAALQRELQATGIPRQILAVLGLVPPEPGRAPLPFDHDADAVARLRMTTAGIIVLLGPTGVGKSVAAASWCWDRRGLYRRAGSVARGSWYGPTSEVDLLIGAPALVLDDLMAEHADARGVWRSHLDELVDARCADARPTVLTSNMPREDLPAGDGHGPIIGLRTVVGERVWDRMQSDGEIIEIVRDSMRGRQAALPGTGV